jgi:hypothetical protein
MNDSFTHDRSVARQGKDVMFAVGIDEARRHCSTSVFFDPQCSLNVDTRRRSNVSNAQIEPFAEG